MLDELHDPLPVPEYDRNIYTLGSIGKFSVVITCPPMGTAAPDIISMTNLFREIKFTLLVGIGSGIPPNVRLGDVVVDTKVAKVNLGNAAADSAIRTQLRNATPSQLLLAALTKIKTEQELSGSRISQYLERLKQDSPKLALGYLKSDSLKDLLFKADYSHVTRNLADSELISSDDDDEEEEEESCQFCDKAMIVNRKPREMLVHYGSIVSASQEIKTRS